MANFISSKMFFDGWATVVRTLVLGTIGYAALILIFRVSGKRTLSVIPEGPTSAKELRNLGVEATPNM